MFSMEILFGWRQLKQLTLVSQNDPVEVVRITQDPLSCWTVCLPDESERIIRVASPEQRVIEHIPSVSNFTTARSDLSDLEFWKQQ